MAIVIHTFRLLVFSHTCERFHTLTAEQYFDFHNALHLVLLAEIILIFVSFRDFKSYVSSQKSCEKAFFVNGRGPYL